MLGLCTADAGTPPAAVPRSGGAPSDPAPAAAWAQPRATAVERTARPEDSRQPYGVHDERPDGGLDAPPRPRVGAGMGDDRVHVRRELRRDRPALGRPRPGHRRAAPDPARRNAPEHAGRDAAAARRVHGPRRPRARRRLSVAPVDALGPALEN